MDEDAAQVSDLVARAREGEEAACAAMVEALFPMVIKIIRGHLPRSEDEEDLAQDVFMKVFTRIDQYAARQPFEHWVSRIALNTCYDRLRRQRTRPVVSYADLDVDETEFLERALTSATAVEDAESVGAEPAEELLAKLFEALNPREQIAVRLLDLEERTVKEAAELTGWGESKVKVTAMRGRRRLSQALERLERERPTTQR